MPTKVTAIALLVVFVATIGVLMMLRRDAGWDRLVYLFGGLEAVVFAAAGALFGTTVQRGAVNAARAEAEKAREEVAHAQAEAKKAAEEATKGEALAHTIKAAGNGPGDTSALGGRPGEDLKPNSHVDPAVRMLAEVARRLFPDGQESAEFRN
jgi:hypothetical protein